MASNPLKIFLSYSSGDKPQVEKLYSFLLAQGTDPWFDAEKLLPGQDWNLEIHKSLDEADVILLCLSKKSVSKEGYIQKEMRLALDLALEMPEGRIFLIPARLEECDLPYKLKSYQWVDLFTEAGMDKLIKSLNLRASQVKANPLSTNSTSPTIKKSAPKKRKQKDQTAATNRY
ncbi:MAG: toll/interleukin-1 receptor domain-containing protein [Anaerolineales bacterium]|nr:toll/interleukin-1 receptor domain-containing protein [Anaerolineales bacterium]